TGLGRVDGQGAAFLDFLGGMSKQHNIILDSFTKNTKKSGRPGGSFPGVFGGQFGILLPGGLQILPDLAIDHAVDLPVEVDGADKAGIGAAGVIAVQLLHGHAALLDDVFLFDAGANEVRPVNLDEPLGFELTDVVDY